MKVELELDDELIELLEKKAAKAGMNLSQAVSILCKNCLKLDKFLWNSSEEIQREAISYLKERLY